MSDQEDMRDCEYRNQFGQPLLNAAAGAAVHSNIDQSVNKPLPWIALAMLLAGFSVALAVWAISEARDTRTQLLLLREDIRQMTIESVKHGKD